MNKQANVSSSSEVPASVRTEKGSAPGDAPHPMPVGESESTSRWHHITQSLGACSGAADVFPEAVRDARGQSRGTLSSNASGRNAKIEILDQPTSRLAVLSWRDPTGCSYCYQTWYKALARRAGRCALSGVPIRPGDAVFRPRLKNTRPVNATAMILAIYIDSR
jgi:hypothetical protein